MHRAVFKTSQLTALPFILVFACGSLLEAKETDTANLPVVAPRPEADAAPVVALMPLSAEPVAAILVAQKDDAKKAAEENSDSKPKPDADKAKTAGKGKKKADNKSGDDKATAKPRKPPEGRGRRRGPMGGFGAMRGRDGADHAKPNADAIFKRLDKNGDGKLTLEEFAAGPGPMHEGGDKKAGDKSDHADRGKGGHRPAFGMGGPRHMGMGMHGRGGHGRAGSHFGRGGQWGMSAFHRGGHGHGKSFASRGGRNWGFGMGRRGFGRMGRSFASRGHRGGGWRGFAFHGAGGRGDAHFGRGFGAHDRGEGGRAKHGRHDDHDKDRGKSGETGRGHGDDRFEKLEAQIKQLREMIASLKKDKNA